MQVLIATNSLHRLTFTQMKQPKEKTKAELEIERLKSKPLPNDLKAVIRSKEKDVNGAFNKGK